MEPLSSDEIERYKRHILLPEIGGTGQQKLKASRVLVIGAGASVHRCFSILRPPAWAPSASWMTTGVALQPAKAGDP